jgi:multiple sugar transport system permease protein
VPVTANAATVAPRAARVRAPGRRRRVSFAGYAFLAPWLVGFFGLTLGPALASLYLSFTNYDLIEAPRWVGLANYARIMTSDAKVSDSVAVTLIYVLLSVPLKLGFALVVALVLNKGIRGLPLYRALFYLPSLLGASVAIATLWREIFSQDGLFNRVLFGIFGIHGPSWVSDPDYALYALVLLSVWQFGSPMIIFLAGLKQLPQDLFEAADLDGATARQRFWKITIPMLTPVIFFNVVVQTIDALKAFTPAFIVSGGTGGPIDATLFYTLYLYQEAFGYLRMGYAAALAWLLVIAIVALTALAFLTSRLWVHYDE